VSGMRRSGAGLASTMTTSPAQLTRSEAKSTSHLNDASGPEVIGPLGGGDLAGSRREYIPIHRRWSCAAANELRMIESIVGIRPDLQIHAFPYAEALSQTEIEIHQPRCAQDVSSRVSKTCFGSGECCWIKPLRR